MKTSLIRTADEDKSDEEAAIDIPPPSPTNALSSTAGIGSSAAPFDYASAFQTLSERLDTISLDVQQICLDHQEDMRTLIGDFHAYREA